VKEKADEVIAGHPNGKPIFFDVNDEQTLEELVKGHDLVVSLVPYTYHVRIARVCICHKRNMVTASYVSPEMKMLDDEARQAGIIILNELGLDPGIDHMSAKKIIDQVHNEGGKILEFYSLCGALPAPESADNPFKYKFSWSPTGVLLASGNSATYKKNNEIVQITSEGLFKDITTVTFDKLGVFEVYPNRDSLPYINIYGIPEATTVMRGTIRYPGWCEILDAMKSVNMLSQEKIILNGNSYAHLMSSIIKSGSTDQIKQNTASALGIKEDSLVIHAFEWLGLFSSKPLPKTEITPFEAVAHAMFEKMIIGPNDRDMVLMLHAFKVRYPDGKEEVIRSAMVDYGTLKTDTAVARTVAWPAAIGVKMILEKKINLTGVHIPVIPDIYLPILHELEALGISMHEQFGLVNCNTLE
jgi:saccharopine dehydrogenase-like NADP-dependent oxidoreductase